MHRDVSKKDENVALHTVVSKAETTTSQEKASFLDKGHLESTSSKGRI